MFKKKSVEKIRKVEKVFWLRKISWRWNFSYRTVLQYIYFSLLGCAALFLCYFFFLSSYFRIDAIYFDEQNVEQIHNLHLYASIQSGFIHKNYFRSFLFPTHDTLEKIRKQYPFVQSIDLIQKTHNSYYISCHFDAPHVVYALGEGIFVGSYDEQFYALSSGDSLLSGQQILLLPFYITTMEQVSGIYSRFSEAKLLRVLKMIKDVIPIETIKTYTLVPGNSLLLLGMDSGQELLLSLVKDINPQLVKRLDVQHYYRDYKQFRFLDLGSTEHIIAR